jgi:hypothetical protein
VRLNDLEKYSFYKYLKNKWVQVSVSLVLTVLFGIAASFLRNFNGAGMFILFVYHLPIGFAFSMFVLTEAANFNMSRMACHVVSLLVIAASLLRAFIEIPFYSGHAFFVTYMLLVTDSLAARFVAAVVLIDVFYVKVFLLHDPTIWGGMVLGLAAFAIVGWVDRNITVLDQ